MPSKRSLCLQYKLTCYPSARKFKILIAYYNTKKIKKAEGLVNLIDEFIKTNIPKYQQDALIKHFDSMTPDEISFPGRIK